MPLYKESTDKEDEKFINFCLDYLKENYPQKEKLIRHFQRRCGYEQDYEYEPKQTQLFSINQEKCLML